jgi:PAS domain S-box-containing protein
MREEMRLEIAEQNKLNRTMFSTAPVGFVMYDEDYNIIECNEHMAAMCGVTTKYFIEHFNDLSPEYQLDGSKSSGKAHEMMRRAFSGEIVINEWVHRTCSGEPVPCEVTALRIKNKDKFIGLAYLYDLRNIKKLEQSVVEAEGRIKLILDATPLSCDLWDRNIKIFDCNDAAVKLFGAKNKQDYIDNFFTFSPEYQSDGQRSDEKAAMYLKKAFAEGRCALEWTHQLPDGTLMPTELIVTRLDYKGDHIAAVYTIDMREHHRMLKEIEDSLLKAQTANQAKSEFMARMSHEMLTPMNAIMGMTQIAKMTGDPKTKKYLDEIYSTSRDLLRMIKDVLDMSNMEFDILKLNITTFSFYAVFERAMKAVELVIEKKQQKFSADVDHSLPPYLSGDERRLTQVITNLLKNAVKFTPDHGEVRFSAHVLENNEKVTLQIEVADNGIGISKEQQENLFTIFEQADGSNTRQFGGMGLGLAFSKRIIEMMGGRIWVESKVGKGSTFTFTCVLDKA